MHAIEGIRTRTLHLIDIENLLGGPHATGADALETLDDYLDAARWQHGDLVYIAANPHLVERFAWDVPVDANVRTAVGADGADLVLLAQCAPEFVARRAGRLVIGSGDHIFIGRARAVRDQGIGVAVVARNESLAVGWGAHGFPVVAIDAPVTAAA
jgi:hypothetical protein